MRPAAEKIIVLSDSDVAMLLDDVELLARLELGLLALSRGAAQLPDRTGLSFADRGFLLTMIGALDHAPITVKVVSVLSAGPGIPPNHNATVLLLDSETGACQAVLGARYLTAVRTAAAACLSAKLLARSGSQILTILGAGDQARHHLRLMSNLRDWQEIRIWARRYDQAAALAAEHRLASAASDLSAAVSGADVVALTTHSSEPLFRAGLLSPGTHVSSVGYCPPGGELSRDIVAAATLFVETARAVAPPPVGCAELAGVPPERAVQLGEVIGGAHPGRISDDELTLYKAMGNVVEDIVAASIVYERAKARGLGTRVAL